MCYCICRCGRPPIDEDYYYSDEGDIDIPVQSILEYRWLGE
jgi:hypothetical protein